jgi:hypothetical protein
LGVALSAVLLLVASSGLAESRWPDQRAAGPFLCHADFSLADNQHLMQELAQLQRDLAPLLGSAEPREPIHLFLFAEKATYQAYLKQYFPGVPDRRALFVKGRGPGMVFAHRNADFEVDVRHESTHALLHATRRHLPLWLDEGLAEYFEAPPRERSFDNPHLRLVRWSARLGRTPKMETLEALETVDAMGRGEYRDAWAWVHFMLHGPAAARSEMIAYLDDLSAERPTAPLSARLRAHLPELDRQFLDHFRTWTR